MMKFTVVLFFSFFSLSLLSQEINPKLYQKTWLDNEIRILNDYSVTKVFGQMPHSPSAYNVLPITAVSYKSYQQMETELLKEKRENQISEKDFELKLNDLKENAKGGEIQVYISRYAEEDANFRWFFVVLRGEDDKDKLWEKEIGYQAPQNPFERGWWNYTTINIPVELKTPFYIYLNDKHSKFLSDFKFRVETASSPSTNN